MKIFTQQPQQLSAPFPRLYHGCQPRPQGYTASLSLSDPYAFPQPNCEPAGGSKARQAAVS